VDNLKVIGIELITIRINTETNQDSWSLSLLGLFSSVRSNNSVPFKLSIAAFFFFVMITTLK